MNEYSKELCHWAIGEKIKGHKYIAREKGKKLGSYVYFYDKDKWQTWKNNAAAGVKKAASNYAKDWKSGAGMIKSSAKEYANLWRFGAGVKTKQEKRMEKRYDKPIGPSNKNVGPTQRMTNQADQHVSDVAKKAVERKYIAKMTTKDGKVRYFYNQKDLDNWVRIQQYQTNEPKFMKGVKEIEPGSVGTTNTIKRDSSATNPDYTKNKKATVNCWHCSTVYDLRKRGYDVSAKPIKSEFGSSDLDEFYDCKSKSASQTSPAKNSTELVAQRLINKDFEKRFPDIPAREFNAATVDKGQLAAYLSAEDNKGATTNIIPARAIADYATKRSAVTDTGTTIKKTISDRAAYGAAMAESINKTIDAYPNNSWGRIGIHYEGFQGGHSIVWEKDDSGKIHYIDAQTNHEVNISTYASFNEKMSALQVQRTDNLQLKEKVLDYVTEHKDGSDNPKIFIDDTSSAYRDDMKTENKIRTGVDRRPTK